MEDYESILLVKPEVFVYKIPPRTTTRSYRAADWDLGNPNWTGRMRLVTKNTECIMKLEDKLSGELFAQCPIDKYPGLAVESVSDSSRYFVIRIQDEGARNAFIGLGFGDRSDSFDLNVALQDHFKYLKNEESAKQEEAVKPDLDLGFKDGQTIKINMKITKKDGQEKGTPSRPKPKSSATGGGFGLIPPPPSGPKAPATASNQQSSSVSNANLLGDINLLNNPDSSSDSWGNFTSANTNRSESSNSSNTNKSDGWVTF